MAHIASAEFEMNQQRQYDCLYKKLEGVNLNKNQRKAFEELITEHGLSGKFTLYYKDEKEKNINICSYSIMLQLVKKGLIKKIDKSYKSSEPHLFEWA
jgi:hypothetical protein